MCRRIWKIEYAMPNPILVIENVGYSIGERALSYRWRRREVSYVPLGARFGWCVPALWDVTWRKYCLHLTKIRGLKDLSSRDSALAGYKLSTGWIRAMQVVLRKRKSSRLLIWGAISILAVQTSVFRRIKSVGSRHDILLWEVVISLFSFRGLGGRLGITRPQKSISYLKKHRYCKWAR